MVPKSGLGALFLKFYRTFIVKHFKHTKVKNGYHALLCPHHPTPTVMFCRTGCPVPSHILLSHKLAVSKP